MIHITNLHKSFGNGGNRVHALRGINLSIDRGEIFGIIGPSGAGKSTLVQCINLLEQPEQGYIDIGGQRLTGLSESLLRQQRRRIGMIFQGFNLLARRTVYGNVALPLEIAGVPASEVGPKVERLLALVGLEPLRDRFPSQISGGQKQRVGIARALANDPDVLLSDEATSALDPETTHTILSLLRDISVKTGITIVMITHQMEVVREICDRVAVLADGEIVESGRTLDVFSAPKHAVTRGMVSAAMASNLAAPTVEVVRARIAGLRQTHPLDAIHLLRLSFSGASDTASLHTELARDFGLDVDVIQARVEDIQGTAVGTFFVLSRGAASSHERALASMIVRNVDVETLI
jgi:D-methionine transport system ATP-binding protein